MRTPLLRSILPACFLVLFVTSAAAATNSLTVALLPVQVSQLPVGAAASPDSFVLDFDPSTPDKRQAVKLTFNLQAIPSGVAIQSVILRLVPTASGSGSASFNQQIRIFTNDQYTTSIGQLIVTSNRKEGASAVESSGSGLVPALRNARETLDLYLRTDSIRTSQSYYSASATPSAYRPRLIVSWTDSAPLVARNGPQLRYRGDPSDVTAWKFGAVKGAVLSKPLSTLGFNQILAGPVFRGEDILLIAKAAANADPKLYGIGWNGNKRWEYALPALTDSKASWKYLHVDAQNRVLAFANDQYIRVFSEFGAAGPAKKDEKKVEGLLLSKRPVVGAGGMVTFLNDNGYVYALSPVPGLGELWRSAINVGKAPPPVLSPRFGDGLAYVIALNEKSRGVGLLAYDAARGEQRFPTGSTQAFPSGSTLANFDGFHPPFVAPGPAHDWVLLSGFNQDNGVIEGYSNFTEGKPDAWRDVIKGPISRCIAPTAAEDAAEPAVFCVQNGRMRGFRPRGSHLCLNEYKKVSTTSNLVGDGAGNVYFWDGKAGQSGVLYGFDNNCNFIFQQPLKGLPDKSDGSDVLELRAGPGGVFYATSDKELFAIQLTHEGAPKALVAGTRYVADGGMALPGAMVSPPNAAVMLSAAGDKLDLGSLQVPATADVTCSAGRGIAFQKGFAVEKGGILRCGIDSAEVATTQ